MYNCAQLIFVLFVVSFVESKPVDDQNDLVGAFYYLNKYGYVPKDANKLTAALMSEDVVTQAVKDFQIFAGLPPTGELDANTTELMNAPRCGVQDVVGPTDQARRKKRFALQGSRWTTDTLTWRISKYPSSSRWTKEEVDKEIKRAFQLWSDVTALKFQKKNSGTAHIDIRFEKKRHGDGDPFDGPGGTLAHAFFPQYGGDAHFDDQEYWTMEQYTGTNLYQTAAHEFGHSLGLSHSDVRSALMAPFYKGYDFNLNLDKDDIDAIQSLYGEPDKVSNPTEEDTPLTPSDLPNREDDDLCKDPNIDTVFGTGDKSYYVFKGANYWKLTEDSVEDGYPRKISDDWPGLPNNIDAAFTWTDNQKTYFFKGSNYWKFDNKKPVPEYPKKITEGFDKIPSDIDAAFVWGGNGKIYFFKGDQYWKFDPSRKPAVQNVYPRQIENWDLPSNIDGALNWSNKRTYFFKGGQYYRFNDRRFAIDSGDPEFPRPAAPWWFGCKQASLPLVTNPSDTRGDPLFRILGLKKKDAAISLSFDLVGDELLDIIAPDE